VQFGLELLCIPSGPIDCDVIHAIDVKRLLRGTKSVPAYKNRPPMPDDTTVWRYLSLSAVVQTIKTRRLRLTRVDTFDDPFEGSVTKKDMETQDILFIGAESRRSTMNIIASYHQGMAGPAKPAEDSWLRMTRLRRARTRSAHASCWSSGDESEAIWRLYCKDGKEGQGVALGTTLACLEGSVASHDLYVSPINYRHYHDDRPAFTDEMDSLLNKRKGFEAEREVRILKFDTAHYSLLIPPDTSVAELDRYIHINWVLGDTIQKIVISPYADEDYEKSVLDAIKEADPKLADRMELSVLHERRFAPQF
jgi:hypothetical protein